MTKGLTNQIDQWMWGDGSNSEKHIFYVFCWSQVYEFYFIFYLFSINIFSHGNSEKYMFFICYTMKFLFVLLLFFNILVL